MVELKDINEDNFEECIALKLNKEQSKFIASNLFSLAEAYAIKNSGMNTPITYGVYNDNIMVGFIMAVYQPIDKNDPEDFENVFYLARMMIDSKYQGKGYGKQAMIKMIEIMKEYPYGAADAVVLSCSRDNTIANKLYSSLGFIDTGETDEDGDVYLRLDLR